MSSLEMIKGNLIAQYYLSDILCPHVLSLLKQQPATTPIKTWDMH